MKNNWYSITNIQKYDTPLLALYPDRVKRNIELAIEMTGGDVSRLRPHIKTHKTGEIITMLLSFGITKIKCATIAEAELAAENGITDVLLAYQPAGPKIDRFISLILHYPDTTFSCLVDNITSAENIASATLENKTGISVYIDLNTGMNRTGFPFSDALAEFYKSIDKIKGLQLLGLHIYDGHLNNPDAKLRSEQAGETLNKVVNNINAIEPHSSVKPKIIAGGSNTFSFYATKPEIECSPGTFIFWDINYTQNLPELKFEPAALLLTRVISKPTIDTLCLDLGYKSVSSENPIDRRIAFPWNPELQALSHSEEHLIVKNTGNVDFNVGDVLYGIPNHICPSCALYDEAQVVIDHQIVKQWRILARQKKITI